MTIKAIQTRYRGCKFRSRLEARYAVLLDALGVEWLYEHEGYQLKDGTPYLPDFWLPSLDMFLEVKPAMPTIDGRERILCQQLHEESGKRVLLVAGLDGDENGGYVAFGFDPVAEVPMRPLSAKLSRRLSMQCESFGETMTCPVCDFNYVHFANEQPQDSDWDGRGDAQRIAFWGECGHRWDVRFGFHKGEVFVAVENCRGDVHGPAVALAGGNSDKYAAAVAAARSARFEHGESGAT